MSKLFMAVILGVLLTGRAHAGDAPAHAAAMIEAASQVMETYPYGVGAPKVNGEFVEGMFTLPDLEGYTGRSYIVDNANCWSCGVDDDSCSKSCMLGKAINAPDTWDCWDENQPPALTNLNRALSFGDAWLADFAGYFDQFDMACNYTHFTSNPKLGPPYSASNAHKITDSWAREIITDIERHQRQCNEPTFKEYVKRVANSLHFVQDMATEHHAVGNSACGMDDLVPTRIDSGRVSRLASFSSCMRDQQNIESFACDDDSGYAGVLRSVCDNASPLACLGLERLIRHHCNLDDSKSIICAGPKHDHHNVTRPVGGKSQTYCEGERFDGDGEQYFNAAVTASVQPFRAMMELWEKTCKEPDIGDCKPVECEHWCENQTPAGATNVARGVCSPAGGHVEPGEHPGSITVVLGEGDDTLCECRPASDPNTEASLDSGVDAAPADAGNVDAGSDDSMPTPPSPPDRDGIPTPPNNEGDAARDPHLLTFDGLRYDMQGAGEFTLVLDTSDGLEVQTRTAPYGASTIAAVNIAVAARIGTDRVTFDVTGSVKVNSEESDRTQAHVTLPDGGELYNPAWGIVLVYPDNSQVAVADNGGFLSVAVHLPDTRANGSVRGLLGNFNEDLEDELQTRDGTLIPAPVDFGAFYNAFVESWRIAQADSLFDYAEHETTETFTDRSFPHHFVRTQDLDESAILYATRVCEEAGISDPAWLDACIFDVAATGDPVFATDHLQPATPKASLELEPPQWPGAEGLFGADAEHSGVRNGGGLGSASEVPGTLGPTERHFFGFVASSGNGIQLRLVDPLGGAFIPKFDVYDAEGTLVASNYTNDVAYASFAAPTTGTFTVVVSDAAQGSEASDYILYFVKAPGSNEGGLLQSGQVTPGTIDKGDLDSFTFTVDAGQGVQLRLADLAGGGFVPALQVYNPDGSNAAFAYTADVAYVSFFATQSGTYTVVAFDWSGGAAESAEYNLYYVKADSETSDGPLTSGQLTSGLIEKGELDSFTFSANSGEGVQLRLADLAGGGFVPALQIYNPDGSNAAFAYTADVAYVSFIASQSGTYTVVAFDWSSGAAESGEYNLYYVKANAETSNGALTAGEIASGTIDKGELDSFTLSATAGDSLRLSLTKLSDNSFVPALQVYNPDGSSAAFIAGANVALASFVATQSGVYTVLAFDWSNGAATTGDYTLEFDVE